MEEMVTRWREAVKQYMPGITEEAVDIFVVQALESLTLAELTIMPMSPTNHLKRIISGAILFITKKEPSEAVVNNFWGSILTASLKGK